MAGWLAAAATASAKDPGTWRAASHPELPEVPPAAVAQISWTPAFEYLLGADHGNLLDDHPRIVLGSSVAVLLQSLMIGALLIHSRRRRKAEADLKLSEERYREVVESQQEMVCRYREDTTLTFVNDAYCRFFLKERKELLGMKFLSLIPAESHAAVDATTRRMIETRKSISSEHQVIRPDGEVGWMSWEDYPIFDQLGKLEEFQGIGRDITKRRVAEEALRQSEERFSGVFRGSPTAISIIRQSDGRLLDVNPSWEKMFEISREQAVGKSPVELGVFENEEADERYLAFLKSGKPLLGFEQLTKTPAGASRWTNVSTELVPLGGEPCFIVMSKNVTEQHEVEEARKGLAQATRLALLGELAASIAHEVNQPLGAILSNAETAEILLDHPNPPLQEIRQILADIRRDDMRASETIKRVRSLITKGEVQMLPLNLNIILLGVTRLVAHDVRRRGVSLVTRIAPDLPDVSGDRVQIEQILLNLMLNAMDASTGTHLLQRTLTLTTSLKCDGWVEVCVSDNGHGIPPETLPRIFESFFSSKEDGMGLGLSLARSISEAHGGRITAENNPSGGATFRVILPVHDEFLKP
ncbi:MAG: PAS domain S-box protein [Verrucomicrobiota bacterium]